MIKTVAIMLFMVGIFVFGMSYHNIDLAFNARYGALDTNGFGYVQDIPTMYMNGLSGMNVSAVFLITGFGMLFKVKEKIHGLEEDGLAKA